MRVEAVGIFNRTKVELRQHCHVFLFLTRELEVGIFNRTKVELRRLPCRAVARTHPVCRNLNRTKVELRWSKRQYANCKKTEAPFDSLFTLHFAIGRLPFLGGIKSKSCVIKNLQVHLEGWSFHRNKVVLRQLKSVVIFAQVLIVQVGIFNRTKVELRLQFMLSFQCESKKLGVEIFNRTKMELRLLVGEKARCDFHNASRKL